LSSAELSHPDVTANRRARRLASACRAIAGWALLLLAATPAAAQVSDEDHLQAVLNQALETERSGVEIPWSNDDTGTRGTILIERTFYLDPNAPCRDYRRTEQAPGDQTLVIRGTGCRVGENDWTLDERAPVREIATPPGEPPVPGGTAAAPSCPPVELPNVVRVPCTKPVPFADYTMPSKAEL
jgi:surface antigen